MIRVITTVSMSLMLVAMVGCGGGSRSSNTGATSASFDSMTDTQIAAWSATSKYPQGVVAKKMDVTVIVNQDKNTIKLYNLSPMPIRNAKLWVNKTFVAKVDGVAPQTNLVVPTDRLYDSIGNVFSKQKLEVTTVQLEMEDGLYDLQGPVAE